MKRLLIVTSLLAVLLLLQPTDGQAQRGRGAAAGAARGHAVVGPYGGSSAGRSSRAAAVGPGGGTIQSGQKSGSVTTPGGSTVKYAGAGAKGTTPGGTSGGRYVGGVQVTTPSGKTVSKAGTGAAAVGPGGNAVGKRSSVGVAQGPGGSAVGVSRGAAAVGPGGAVGTRYQGGVAVGSHGAAAGASRGVVARTPGGTAIAGGRVGGTSWGTHYRSGTVLTNQGIYVRRGFSHYNCFTPRWYSQYPGAWYAAGWAANTVWRAATWATVSAFCSYPSAPVYYDHGNTIVYEGDTVYVNGDRAASAEEYSQQAAALADAGREAKPSRDEEWQPLGVFAVVQGDEQTANQIFQLAIDKQGMIRGNYYNALADTTEPVAGSVDKTTQRAAWTVGERKHPVYETGIANLSKGESTMLAHYAQDKTQQFSLIRIEKPEDGEEK